MHIAFNFLTAIHVPILSLSTAHSTHPQQPLIGALGSISNGPLNGTINTPSAALITPPQRFVQRTLGSPHNSTSAARFCTKPCSQN